MQPASASSEVLIAAETGVVKAWAIRRLPSGQQWDGNRIKEIKGSPTNWKVDASEDPQLVEVEDQDEESDEEGD